MFEVQGLGEEGEGRGAGGVRGHGVDGWWEGGGREEIVYEQCSSGEMCSSRSRFGIVLVRYDEY